MRTTTDDGTAPQWLTVREAASELGITERAVQHRIKTGTLAATKFGQGLTSPYMIERAEVERVKAGAA